MLLIQNKYQIQKNDKLADFRQKVEKYRQKKQIEKRNISYFCKIKSNTMRKLIFLFAVIAMVGCKSTSPVTTKVDNKTERTLKGNWMITSVSYPGSDYIKVKSFEMFDSQCFVNSNWSFVSNNNKGTMALTDCGSFASDITWYVNKEGQVVLKILNAEKSKKVNQGYVLNVGTITENSFQLIDKINVGGSPANVVYQFERK